MKNRVVAAVAVLLAAAVSAGVLYGVDVNPWLYLYAPISTLILILAAIAAVVLIITGVTKKRRDQRQIDVQAQVREEERNQRRTFLRRLDHEIKNPVTAIRTSLATMPGEDEAVRVANAQAHRLSSLVNELAKLADLETRPIELIPVNLKDAAEEAADAVLATYPDRDILVEFPQVPWPVPDVLGDPDLLVVALYNVISNAAKYSDADAHIEVRASEADGWVSVDISDTGWGIPEKDMQIIWEELARGSDTRGAQGSGLGLAIVRVIAERHGGSAALRSSPGQGTRVTLRLRAAS